VLLAFGRRADRGHMVYFLHMNAKSEGGWNMLALMFTVMVVIACPVRSGSCTT
jgi:cytochrome o ubiquinol oxidase operon protein cyoD